MTSISEELARTSAKCARLREDVKRLRAAADESGITALRAEVDAYKKALSTIAYRLERDGQISVRDLRSIVLEGLDLRTIKPARRARVRVTRTAGAGEQVRRAP